MLWSIRVVIVVLVLVVHDMKFLQGSDYLGNWRLLRINKSPLVEFSPCSTSVPQWTPCKPGKQKASIKTPCKPGYKKTPCELGPMSTSPLSFPPLLGCLSTPLGLHLGSLAAHPLDLWGTRRAAQGVGEIRPVEPFSWYQATDAVAVADAVASDLISKWASSWSCFQQLFFFLFWDWYYYHYVLIHCSSSDLDLWSFHRWEWSSGCSITVAIKLDAGCASTLCRLKSLIQSLCMRSSLCNNCVSIIHILNKSHKCYGFPCVFQTISYHVPEIL